MWEKCVKIVGVKCFLCFFSWKSNYNKNNRPCPLSYSEIMTILVLFHAKRFRGLKSILPDACVQAHGEWGGDERAVEGAMCEPSAHGCAAKSDVLEASAGGFWPVDAWIWPNGRCLMVENSKFVPKPRPPLKSISIHNFILTHHFKIAWTWKIFQEFFWW